MNVPIQHALTLDSALGKSAYLRDLSLHVQGLSLELEQHVQSPRELQSLSSPFLLVRDARLLRVLTVLALHVASLLIFGPRPVGIIRL